MSKKTFGLFGLGLVAALAIVTALTTASTTIGATMVEYALLF